MLKKNDTPKPESTIPGLQMASWVKEEIIMHFLRRLPFDLVVAFRKRNIENGSIAKGYVWCNYIKLIIGTVFDPKDIFLSVVLGKMQSGK